MRAFDWQLVAVGSLPIFVAILTLSGIWFPKMRSYHKYTRESLGKLTTFGAALFVSSFGLELIWKGLHPITQKHTDAWFVVLAALGIICFVCGCVIRLK